jgi:hypothetical protein
MTPNESGAPPPHALVIPNHPHTFVIPNRVSGEESASTTDNRTSSPISAMPLTPFRKSKRGSLRRPGVTEG